jgi:hypothetical protein
MANPDLPDELELLKARIMKALDESSIPNDETLNLVEDYLVKLGGEFETKMEARKIRRADYFQWKRPVLCFKLIRHPGDLRRQTWEINFSTDEVSLVSEGIIPQSKPYKVERDAVEIMNAILSGGEHPCIIRRRGLIVINPRKIPELVNAPKQTVEGRAKRLRTQIMELMKSHPEFELTHYRSMMAYKRASSTNDV